MAQPDEFDGVFALQECGQIWIALFWHGAVRPGLVRVEEEIGFIQPQRVGKEALTDIHCIQNIGPPVYKDVTMVIPMRGLFDRFQMYPAWNGPKLFASRQDGDGAHNEHASNQG